MQSSANALTHGKTIEVDLWLSFYTTSSLTCKHQWREIVACNGMLLIYIRPASTLAHQQWPMVMLAGQMHPPRCWFPSTIGLDWHFEWRQVLTHCYARQCRAPHGFDGQPLRGSRCTVGWGIGPQVMDGWSCNNIERWHLSIYSWHWRHHSALGCNDWPATVSMWRWLTGYCILEALTN